MKARLKGIKVICKRGETITETGINYDDTPINLMLTAETAESEGHSSRSE